MSELIVIFDTLAATLFPMFVNLVWQFALLAGCVWLVTRVGWIRSAPTQYMLWLMCIFSPAWLVCLGFLLPNVNILFHEGIGHSFRDAPTISEVSYQWIDEDPHVALAVQAAGLHNSPTTASYAKDDSLSEIQSHLSTTSTPLVRSNNSIREVFANWLSYAPLIAGLFWMAGFGFSILHIGWGILGLRRLRKSAKPITSGSLLDLLETLKARMDVRRSVMIAVSHHVHAPISLGFWHPVILLPGKLEADDPEGLRLALIHELAHVRRCDVLVNWCQRVFSAICFFHPLFHLASRRLTQAREQICDNWVIQQSGKRGEYAAFLAGLLESATSNGVARAISLAVIPAKYSVAGRINMILEPRNSGKTSLTRKRAVVVLLLGMVLAIFLSATRILPMPSSAAIPEQSRQGSTLTGTVYREDGKTPFAGAWVYVQPTIHKPTGGGRYFGPVQTDDLGRYEFRELPTQRMEIRAYANRMLPESKILTLDAQNPIAQDFVLEPAATISGKVTAPGKVETVYLDFKSDVHIIRSVAAINPDGSYWVVLTESRVFEIDGVKHYEQAGQENWERDETRGLPGTVKYRLTARVKGYEAVEVPQVIATRGENTANIDIVPVQPTGSISGRMVDEEGNPVPGMELMLVTVKFEDHMGWISSPLDPKTVSQADGSFTFDDVTEGYHQIAPLAHLGAWTPEETPKHTFNQKLVAVPRAQAVTGVEIVVKPNPVVFITGRILRSDGETPIVNTKIERHYRQVSERGSGGGSGSFYTDDEGRYVFKDHEGGTFHLTMMLNGAAVEQEIEAKDGQHIKGVDFIMPDVPDLDGEYIKGPDYMVPGAPQSNVIRGRVLSWDEKRPIGDLSVTLTRRDGLSNGEEQRYFAFAGGDGYFQSFGMADGKYTVKVERTYNEFMSSNARLLPQSVAEVTVKDGISDEVAIYLLRGGTVSGKVFSAKTGEAIKKAQLLGARFDGRDVYDGEYELHDLELGAHSITVEAEGYYPLERTISLGVGKNVFDFDFPMNPIGGQSLAGVVVLSNGRPVPNVMISLFRMDRMLPRILQRSQTSSPDGEFQFQNVPPGEYRILLNAVGFPRQVHTLEIAEDPVADLELQLLRGGIVSGRITVPEGSHLPDKPLILVGTDADAKGVSVSSSEVTDRSFLPYPAIPGRYTAQPSEPDLKFRIENVLPGEYWLILWDNTPQILSLHGPRMRAPATLPGKIEVKEGAETMVELRLPVYGKLEGRIIDAYTGAPVADATVLAVNGESHAFSRGAISSVDGEYSIHVIPGRYERMEVSTHAADASHRSNDVYSFKTNGFSVEEGQTVRMDMEVRIVSLAAIIEEARANDSLVKSGMGYVDIKRVPVQRPVGYKMTANGKPLTIYGVRRYTGYFYAFEGKKIRLEEEEMSDFGDEGTSYKRSIKAYDGEESECVVYDEWGQIVSRGKTFIPDRLNLITWGLTVYGVPLADFLQGNTDEKNLKAFSVVVLGDEQIGGDRCHVVKAIVRGGVIKLWISPEKGYRIRKIQRGSSVSLITLRKYIDDMWIPGYADDIWIPDRIVTRHYTFDNESKERKLFSEEEITIGEDFEINIDVPDDLFDIESDNGF
jgi:beta-lactamase regulating signal transducer with metallopeptidase domain